jgi:hypothetical protein
MKDFAKELCAHEFAIYDLVAEMVESANGCPINFKVEEMAAPLRVALDTLYGYATRLDAKLGD